MRAKVCAEDAALALYIRGMQCFLLIFEGAGRGSFAGFEMLASVLAVCDDSVHRPTHTFAATILQAASFAR